jgi:hypothetical protein
MFKVYAGYYELFISTSTLNRPFMWQGEFNTIEEAEAFLDENFDTENNSVFYERSIYGQSRLAECALDDEEAEIYRFDVTSDGDVLQCTAEWKRQQGII